MEIKVSGKEIKKPYKLTKLLSHKTSVGERMLAYPPESEKHLQTYSNSHEGYNLMYLKSENKAKSEAGDK